MKKKKKNPNELIRNKKAYHEYTIIDRYEAGIALTGSEIKSCRNHGVNFKDSHVRIKNGEAFLINLHISKYKMASIFNHDPVRERRLLLHKKEIRKLYAGVKEKGLTIVPLRLYFKHGFLKVEIALVKGKNLFDKRDDIKKKDIQKEWNRKRLDY